MFVRSLRLVWLAPTKQLMLLWNVVRKQRTMAQMSTHIFSALQRSPTLLLEYVRGWTSTVLCEEKDYSTAAAYLMGSLFQNIWLKCWYACWKANIFIMWPFYSVGQTSSIPSSRRENCMLALFSFLAFSFSISSSDLLSKWQVRCNSIDWSRITDHIHPELAKWLKVRCAASAKPFWKKASNIIWSDATKWYLHLLTTWNDYLLIGWKRGLEPSIFVSGVRVRNHFEMRSHARIYCSPKGMKQCDSIDSSHCAPILAHCAPLGSLSNYQLRSFFFR